MANSQRHFRSSSSFLFELCGWTFVLGLGVWELTQRAGGFGAWLQTCVAAMGVVKAGWSLGSGDQ